MTSISRAILRCAATEMLAAGEPDTFHYQPGLGIIASRGGAQILVGNRALLAQQGVDATSLAQPTDGQAEVLVARSGRAIGAIRLSDVLRPEARDAIRQLRELGLRTVLLTGDAALVAHAVGNQLQVDEVRAELMPHQKQQHIEALQRDGQIVAMIGDGVNDAPALAQATVGVAMGSGTAVAMESADVVLIGSDLGKFVETVRIARRCRRIIWQNFAGTLVVDGLGVGLAAFGLLNPLLAAFIHVASELTFILNSTRLLPRTQGVAVGPAAPLQDRSASTGRIAA